MKEKDSVRAELEKTAQFHIDLHKRVREGRTNKYWYPLSLPTFGAEEIAEAFESMCSFETSMWDRTAMFENSFAEYIGCKEAVMVNSGSSADLLMCFALNNKIRGYLKNGDEILVPIVTWPTQIWSVMMAGLKPVFVDADPTTFNMDVHDLEMKITEKTKAIFLTHLMGNVTSLSSLLDLATRHNLLVIEDCCEALGTTWNGKRTGSFGMMSSFSFFFSHHITTMEGGMIACDSEILADDLRVLRAHGWARNNRHGCPELSGGYYNVDLRYAFVNWGFNVRPTEIQASFGLHQLEKISSFTVKRQAHAKTFSNFLANVDWLSYPSVNVEAVPSWFALPVIVWENAPFTKTDITSYLEGAGIETRPIVVGCLANHPAWKLFPEYADLKFPGAQKIHEQAFYIGLSPMVTDQMLSEVITIFEDFLNRYK